MGFFLPTLPTITGQTPLPVKNPEPRDKERGGVVARNAERRLLGVVSTERKEFGAFGDVALAAFLIEYALLGAAYVILTRVMQLTSHSPGPRRSPRYC